MRNIKRTFGRVQEVTGIEFNRLKWLTKIFRYCRNDYSMYKRKIRLYLVFIEVINNCVPYKGMSPSSLSGEKLTLTLVSRKPNMCQSTKLPFNIQSNEMT